jgi:hypothetical protein
MSSKIDAIFSLTASRKLATSAEGESKDDVDEKRRITKNESVEKYLIDRNRISSKK